MVLEVVTAGGGAVPPLVEPVLGVVVTAVLDVVVELVVVAGVVATAGVVVVEEAVEVVPDTPELPVRPVEPAGVVEPRLSSVLPVAGVSVGTVLGALSATWEPPQAASATAPAAAPSNASGRAARTVRPRGEACDARTSGSR